MEEFEEKDYDQARNYADNIKANAENIMDIFNNIDATMNSLYGSNWESSGAENAHERYNEIRTNYQVFYENVVAMKEHVYKVTNANEAADRAASQNIAAV